MRPSVTQISIVLWPFMLPFLPFGHLGSFTLMPFTEDCMKDEQWNICIIWRHIIQNTSSEEVWRECCIATRMSAHWLSPIHLSWLKSMKMAWIPRWLWHIYKIPLWKWVGAAGFNMDVAATFFHFSFVQPCLKVNLLPFMLPVIWSLNSIASTLHNVGNRVTTSKYINY